MSAQTHSATPDQLSDDKRDCALSTPSGAGQLHRQCETGQRFESAHLGREQLVKVPTQTVLLSALSATGSSRWSRSGRRARTSPPSGRPASSLLAGARAIAKASMGQTCRAVSRPEARRPFGRSRQLGSSDEGNEMRKLRADSRSMNLDEPHSGPADPGGGARSICPRRPGKGPR